MDFASCARHLRSSLLAVLRELGAPVERMSDVPGALRERRAEHWRERIPPVVTLPSGSSSLAFGSAWRSATSRPASPISIRLEDKRAVQRTVASNRLGWSRAVDVDGETFASTVLPLPSGLPVGYHRLRLRTAKWTAESWLLIAPERCPGVGRSRPWGVFLPLYALTTEDSLGAASLDDLKLLAQLRWSRRHKS